MEDNKPDLLKLHEALRLNLIEAYVMLWKSADLSQREMATARIRNETFHTLRALNSMPIHDRIKWYRINSESQLKYIHIAHST